MVIMFATIQNANDRTRLETLYIEHASCMYKVACSILKDEYLAQDAVQEAFIKIANNLNKIKENDCNKTRALFVIIVMLLLAMWKILYLKIRLRTIKLQKLYFPQSSTRK